MNHFNPDLYISSANIFLIGVGGTGSILGRHLARTLYHMKAQRLHTPGKIVFIDPDIVEEHNVGRQMFTHADIGHHKAELIATRLNMALGLEIEYINEAFTAEGMKELVRTHGTNIILGAVDNYLARQEIATLADNRNKLLWIDAGNDRSSGQVIIGNAGENWYRRNDFKHEEAYDYLPHAGIVFPELLDPSDEVEPDTEGMSCAELLALGTQHLLINDMMANIAAQYLYKVLFNEPIYSHMTYVDADSLTVKSVPLTDDSLSPYITENDRTLVQTSA